MILLSSVLKYLFSIIPILRSLLYLVSHTVYYTKLTSILLYIIISILPSKKMLHRLICFLIFTTNQIPDYKHLYAPYITPTDSILNKVHTKYYSEYFHNIIEESHEKVVMVSAVVYDACDRFSSSGIDYKMNDFFQGEVDDVETYISKMVSTKYTDDDDNTLPYVKPDFDIVELYKGTSIPGEETLQKSYSFDQCIVYNYNYDKCTIDFPN